MAGWRERFTAVTVCAIVMGSSARQALSQPASQPQAVQVRMTNGLRYQPAALTVPVGTTVEWVNASEAPHTVTADKALAQDASHVELPAGAAPFNSGLILPGKTWEHTFTIAGRYRYFCIPHEAMGMLGEITVTSARQAATASQPVAQGQGPSISGPAGRHEHNWFEAMLYWLGNFHPPATSFPIALLLCAALAVVLGTVRPQPLYDEGLRYCLLLGILAAWVVTGLGWCYAGFNPGRDNWLMATHRWLGTGTAAWAVVLALLYRASRREGAAHARKALVAAIFFAALLVAVTGFFGGALVFGLGHYADYGR